MDINIETGCVMMELNKVVIQCNDCDVGIWQPFLKYAYPSLLEWCTPFENVVNLLIFDGTSGELVEKLFELESTLDELK